MNEVTPAQPMPLGSEQQQMLTRVVNRLARDYEITFPREQVQAIFTDSYQRLIQTAKVAGFVPVLAERLTRERLDAQAQVEGKIAKRVPEVLFVCVHNAGRSQMAAAFARHYANNQLHIRTGGSDPGERIHPEVGHAMKEVGLSLDEEFPKPLTNEVVAAADIVITMGCGDECPFIPGRRYEDWPITDPATATPEQVAVIRDDVDARVRNLITDLLPDLTLPT